MSRSPRRQQWTRRQAVGGSLLSAAGLSAAAPAVGGNRDGVIPRENAKRGYAHWLLSAYRNEGYRSAVIEGFADRMSVKAGEKLTLFVSANPPGRFRIDVFRMGYYGGRGARLVGEYGPFEAAAQPTPAPGPRRLRECTWKPSTEIVVGADWTSGVYLAKLTRLRTGPKSSPRDYQSYIVFVVRDDRQADVLFQCSTNTWQAYNKWPVADSLYDYGSPGKPLRPGVEVSFDRPFAKYPQVVDQPLTLGSGEFLPFEFPLAFWLEREGYDVTYTTNQDVHEAPAEARRGKAFLSVGHDEYWSRAMFDHVAGAVQAGTNVAFLSGNSVCFVTPFSPNATGAPCRRITRAGRYGGVRPLETAYMEPFSETGPNESLLIGAQTVSPFNGAGDWICTRPDHWLFVGTGMKAGDRIPGLVGWEFHGEPAKLPGLEVVAAGTALTGDDKPSDWTATIYPGPKGNWVFNASTIYWAQGLSSPPGHVLPTAHWGRPIGPDPRVEAITHNFLRRALGAAGGTTR